MSFLLDPPLLIISGILLFYISKWLEWKQVAKIAVGFAIVFSFISLSTLLYTDDIKCTLPLCDDQTGSEFMFNYDWTGIDKDNFPDKLAGFLPLGLAIWLAKWFAVIMFVLYPIWITIGYSLAMTYGKEEYKEKHPVPPEVYTLADVRSRERRVNPGDAKWTAIRMTWPDKAVAEAIKELGGMDKYLKEGDIVVIKINVCGGVPGIPGSFTSKEIVEGVVDQVHDITKEKVTLVDADMVWTKFDRAAEGIGWIDWARERKDKVRLVNLSTNYDFASGEQAYYIDEMGEKKEYRTVNFDFSPIDHEEFCEVIDGDFPEDLRKEHVSELMVLADFIISIPAMKTHSLTDVTLSMKNMYGTFPEIDKAKYHQIGIDDVIVWMNRAFTPNLAIIDGIVGGEAIGPLQVRSVEYQTIVASENVVLADGIAARLMGWEKPLDVITHLNHAYKCGLADEGVKEKVDEFSIEQFQDEHFPNFKDGKWERPYHKATHLYDWAINLMLQIPGMCFLFNLVSDFFAYDLVKMPVIGNLTITLMEATNDILRYLFTAFPKARSTKGNSLIILAVILGCLYGFIFEDIYRRTDLFYEINLMTTFVVSLLISSRMKRVNLLALVASSLTMATVVEYLGTTAGFWTYQYKDILNIPGFEIPIFSIFGWPLLMLTFLGFTVILKDLVSGLGIFKVFKEGGKFYYKILNASPPVLALVMVYFFLFQEGAGTADTITIVIMYAVMALFGAIYSYRHDMDWSVSLMVVGIFLGGFMELLGKMNGLYVYSVQGDLLPMFLVVGWSLNTFTVHALPYLLGIDMEDSFGGCSR